MRIYLFVRDEYLIGKLKAELSEIAECTFGTAPDSREDALVISDGEYPLPHGVTADITVCEGGTVPRQFKIGTLRNIITSRSKASRLSLSENRIAILDGRQIRLTELEAALLRALLKAEGQLVDRRALCTEVFGGEGEDRMLNLYVHYLREKLEAFGEKIILSARGGGYRISGDFIGAATDAEEV